MSHRGEWGQKLGKAELHQKAELWPIPDLFWTKRGATIEERKGQEEMVCPLI